MPGFCMYLPSWNFTCIIAAWFMSLLLVRMGQRSSYEPPLRRPASPCVKMPLNSQEFVTLE
ncbi:hypothetical protein LEMLEM_LOCUS12232, partial [Lemmus lemmus]